MVPIGTSNGAVGVVFAGSRINFWIILSSTVTSTESDTPSSTAVTVTTPLPPLKYYYPSTSQQMSR